MKNLKKCSKCGSEDIFKASTLETVAIPLTVSPKTGIFKEKGIFEAYICKKCGYAELYVKNVENLS